MWDVACISFQRLPYCLRKKRKETDRNDDNLFPLLSRTGNKKMLINSNWLNSHKYQTRRYLSHKTQPLLCCFSCFLIRCTQWEKCVLSFKTLQWCNSLKNMINRDFQYSYSYITALSAASCNMRINTSVISWQLVCISFPLKTTSSCLIPYYHKQ